MANEKTKAVYEAIAAVQGEMAKEGISKARKNQMQGYAFRGIDDIYNALAPLLSKNGLCILPRVLQRHVTEQQSKQGGLLFYTVVDVEFDLVSSKDGSMHTIKVCGEAMDSGDKATNKAMSAAYKYACLQTFCIPTEGDNDADAKTHELAEKPKPEPTTGPTKEKAPSKTAPTIMDWTLIDNMEVKMVEGKKIAKLKFGEIVMYCDKLDMIKTLAIAHDQKKKVKVKFDASGETKTLLDFKTE